MGIVVLFIAILPKLAVAGRDLFRAEVPDPIGDKLRPRLGQSAKILWSVYVMLSVAEAVALWISGMGVYDALCTTFSTMSTGGFSPHSESIAFFGSPAIELIVIFFMVVAGANFALHFWLLRGEQKRLLRDPEFRLYLCIISCATLLITIMLWRSSGIHSIRLALFQVVSIHTGTGFTTANFDAWSVMESILSFFILYILIFAVASLIMSALGMDVVSATSAAATTLGNVGPGFNMIGPAMHFGEVHPIGKLVLILCMWIGRLEIFTVIVLLIPDFWKK
jgi:trk system potassium uptake protein TrkH